MDRISDSVQAEFSPDGVRAQVLSDFRIVRAHQLSQALDDVFLSDFHRNAGPSDHVLYEGHELREYSLVHFEEFLS